MIVTSARTTQPDPSSATSPDTYGTEVHWLLSGAQGGSENLVVNQSRLPGGTRHVLHRHEHAEQLTVVLSGRGLHLTEDAEVPVGPGDVVLVPAGEWHGFANPFDQDVVILNVYGGVNARERAGYELYEPVSSPTDSAPSSQE